jgi:hypothetical protein
VNFLRCIQWSLSHNCRFDIFLCTYACVLFLQGFGGKFGVQSDRVDKSAHDFSEQPERIGTNYEKPKLDVGELGVPLPKFLMTCHFFKKNRFLQNSHNAY